MDPNAISEIKELFQYGALGIMAVSFIAYVWWNARNTAKVLKEKDAYIALLNDKREEMATTYCRSVDALTTQVGQLVLMIDRRSKR